MLNFLSFSKEKNIIVVMLDMFTGVHFKEILKKDPSLYKTFSGFYYYPDTLSLGANTIFGKAPIIGGEEIAPSKMLRADGISLEKKINSAYETLFTDLHKKNWSITFHDNVWLKPNLLSKDIRKSLNLNTNFYFSHVFFDDWSREKRVNLDKKNYNPTFLLSFSLFRISPLKLKKNIYKQGTWLNSVSSSYANKENAKKYSQLRYLSKYSNSNNPSKAFKFITNEITHVPWALNKRCEPINVSEDQAFWSSGMQLQNEYCAIQALAQWVDWMKKEGIYNNSLIIFVSDHGRGPRSKPVLPDADTNFKDYVSPRLSTPFGLQANALLLVKPFNSSGFLKIEEDPMLNSDVRKMIDMAIEGQSGKITVEGNRSREILSGNWRREAHPSDRFTEMKAAQVKGDQFDSKNWKTVPLE